MFSLNWDVEKPDPPILGRKPLSHHIIELKPGTDDYYDSFYPQASSQWDALCHMPHPHLRLLQRPQQDEITGKPGSRNGIEHWAKRGIVGRFVLADVERYRRHVGRPIAQDDADPVSPETSTPPSSSKELARNRRRPARTHGVGGLVRARMRVHAGGSPKPDKTYTRLVLPAAKTWRHGSGTSTSQPSPVTSPPSRSSPVALELTGPEASTYDSYLHFRIIPLLGPRRRRNVRAGRTRSTTAQRTPSTVGCSRPRPSTSLAAQVRPPTRSR